MRIYNAAAIAAILATLTATTVAAALWFKLVSIEPHGFNAPPSPQPPAQAEAWGMLSSFVSQTSSGGKTGNDPGQNLMEHGWQSRCQIAGSGGSCPSAFTQFDQKHFVHGALAQVFLTHQRYRASIQRGARRGRSQLKGGADPLRADLLTDQVLYNAAAGACFSQMAGIDTADPSRCVTIGNDTFALGSMIFRPLWAIIPKNHQVVTIPIYVPGITTIDPGDTGASQLEQWGWRALDFQNNVCPAIVPDDDSSIPVDCFYRAQITAANQSFFSTQTPIDVGSTLILLGFHLIERQSGGWFWSTFGWQEQTSPVDGSFFKYFCGGVNLCSQPVELWAHYQMDVVVPQENDQVSPPVFNPYIDASDQNNSKTNCVVCHSLAAYPAGANEEKGTAVDVTQSRLNQMIRKYVTNAHPPLTQTDSAWTPAKYRTPPNKSDFPRELVLGVKK